MNLLLSNKNIDLLNQVDSDESEDKIMKVKIGIDGIASSEKPTNGNIVRTRERAVANWTEIELEKLADLNGNKGHTINPAHLQEGMKAERCVEMQIFALDFDSGCTFTEIKNRCDSMRLNITYAYHTFSSTNEKEKFRIIFVLDEPEQDSFIIKVMLNMLIKIFPECDQNCKDMYRIYFGGKKLIYYDGNARITLEQLYFPFLESLDIGTHYKENIKRFGSKMNITMINNNLCMGRLKDQEVIFGKKMDSPVIHITAESKNFPFFIAEGKLLPDNTCSKEHIRKITLGNDITACQLYDDFKSGIELSFDEKFAIATNLININGGRKHFLGIIRQTYGEDSFGRWERHLKYMKGYYPKRCSEEFCPYYKECVHENTIVDTLAMDRKVYQGKVDYVSIKDAANKLEMNIYNAFHSIEKGVHLIKAQTGLGKTTAYINLIRENQGNRFLIALPTNALKKEVGEKMRNSGIPADNIYITPSINGNDFITYEIQEEIAQLHQCGIHNKTKSIIRSYLKEIKEKTPYELAKIEECEKFLKDTNEIEERIVVTTHAYFLQMKEETLKKFTIIIDEDFLILQGFNRMCNVSIRCLEELAKKGFGAYSKVAGMLLEAQEGIYQKMDMECVGSLTEEQIEGLECFDIGDNINDLKDARTFVRMKDCNTGKDIIKYFCPPSIPKMKYIVLSATFNYTIYHLYFKGKMEVFLYGEQKAAYKGKLIQYTYHSLGRKDLSEKMEVFDAAKRIVGKEEVEIITFKYIEKNRGVNRLNRAGIHFGNSTGINILSGKDLVIIGTPYSVDENYKLIACYLGADVNKKEDKRPLWRRVNYKNNSFLITTYTDKILKEVQLYSLESELEQCVGRARLLRNDCTVYLFSSFPCEQAHIDSRNYLVDLQSE